MPTIDDRVMTAQYVEARLKTIVIEDFTIQKAELSKAIAYLEIGAPDRLQSEFRLTSADPDRN